MNIIDAVKSGEKFFLANQTRVIQYFEQRTGKFGHLVDSSYFMTEDGYITSLGLYPEELLSEEWELKNE